MAERAKTGGDSGGRELHTDHSTVPQNTATATVRPKVGCREFTFATGRRGNWAACEG